ncbi:mitochondrial distribution and morphology protein 10 [Crepidotus variabilis]|uniref:Mitochondrial distribution and morphology protein 10 n=1 Tax=Crepidotus variabilis TaxID=179855 RepID=A0A9P6EQW4_9AGAR|nr:mitochondrial distribution and morphology protein 10 [Crepidotus variabilis]
MHPFATYVLRNYYQATGWNDDNLFANITRSSNAILDFTVPRGLHISVAKSPNSLFKTSYSMTAMPSLNGSVGYIFTSCGLNIKSSGTVPFKDMIDRFLVYEQPRKPEAKEIEYLAGESITNRDYLLYGRLYLPTGRLDAVYSLRLSPTLQALVAAISDPPSPTPQDFRGRRSDPSNIMVSLQHDVGKWCTEYSWSAEDEMWGVKFLHNFGRLGHSTESADEAATRKRIGVKRVDEEEPVEGGLKGRVSVGAELYFSAKEKSAGLSTGIRFTTLPDATPPSAQLQTLSTPYRPAQPPTTITALFNPMLGHISSAYTARVSKDLALSSRFDFNVYSFESEWTVGAEWWLRRPSRLPIDHDSDNPIAVTALEPVPPLAVNGVVKARASTNNNVSLMWEGRLRNMLVSLGVVSDLSSRSKFIKALGLEVAYFSSE